MAFLLNKHSFFSHLFPAQSSQAAASIDNRVPTPASVAELSSQQALPDMNSTESTFQIKKEEDDNTVGKKQVDIKMEVLHSVFEDNFLIHR